MLHFAPKTRDYKSPARSSAFRRSPKRHHYKSLLPGGEGTGVRAKVWLLSSGGEGRGEGG